MCLECTPVRFVLRFPLRPNFRFLVGWGAPRSRGLHPSDTGAHPGEILDYDQGSEEGCYIFLKSFLRNNFVFIFLLTYIHCSRVEKIKFF